MDKLPPEHLKPEIGCNFVINNKKIIHKQWTDHLQLTQVTLHNKNSTQNTIQTTNKYEQP